MLNCRRSLQIQHSFFALRKGHNHQNWVRVPDDKMPDVRAKEAITHDPLFHWQAPSANKTWACALCVDWHGSRDELRAHMKATSVS